MKRLLSAMLAALILSGCGAIRPPRPQPPPVDPPPVQEFTVRVHIHDLMNPLVGVPGVFGSCESHVFFTDENGDWEFTAFGPRQLNCVLTKDGYDKQEASVFVDGVDQLRTWMKKERPPYSVSRNERQGVLRLDGNGYQDDSGPVNPVYAHCGDCFALFKEDRNRALVLQQLDDVARAGFHGIRVWATLGCGGGSCNDPRDYWYGRDIGPRITPGYWDLLRDFANAMRRHGLRAVLSQGDIAQIGSDRRGYMERLAQLNLEVGGFIDFIDGANEAWQTGEPNPQKLAEFVGYYLNSGGRGVPSLTSPIGEGKEELDRYSINPALIFDVHSYRGGHSWDKRRHIFSIPYEGKPMRLFGIGSEPPGNGAAVSVTENKHELDDEAVPLLAVASIYARQAFVWFSGEGVKLNQGLMTQAGFWTTPTAVEWMPKDTMSFATLHHSGASWSSIRVLAASGEARPDCRTNGDGRFVCTVDGPSGNHSFQVERTFSGRLCNPGDGVCQEVSRSRGETLNMTFTRGRVLEGRAQ